MFVMELIVCVACCIMVLLDTVIVIILLIELKDDRVMHKIILDELKDLLARQLLARKTRQVKKENLDKQKSLIAPENPTENPKLGNSNDQKEKPIC